MSDLELFELIRRMPNRYRVLDLSTDTIYRFVEEKWIKVGKVSRVDEELGEDLIKLPKKRTVKA